MIIEDTRTTIALHEIAAVETYTGKPLPKALAAARDRHLDMQTGPGNVLDLVAGRLADTKTKLTAETLAHAADEVIAARALELQREVVTRELIGAAASLTGERLYDEFKASIPALWHAVDLCAQDSFKVITENATKAPPTYSNEIAWDDADEDRQNSWRLLKGAANSIATAHGIRQRWRTHRFLSVPQHDAEDICGLIQNGQAIGSTLPAIGQTSVQWLVAAARAGGQFWLPLSGEQDRAFRAGPPPVGGVRFESSSL